MWLYSFDRGSARGHVRAWYELARSRSPAPPGRYLTSLYCRRGRYRVDAGVRYRVRGRGPAGGGAGPAATGTARRQAPDVGGAV